jgi:hypothetical protein
MGRGLDARAAVSLAFMSRRQFQCAPTPSACVVLDGSRCRFPRYSQRQPLSFSLVYSGQPRHCSRSEARCSGVIAAQSRSAIPWRRWERRRFSVPVIQLSYDSGPVRRCDLTCRHSDSIAFPARVRYRSAALACARPCARRFLADPVRRAS